MLFRSEERRGLCLPGFPSKCNPSVRAAAASSKFGFSILRSTFCFALVRYSPRFRACPSLSLSTNHLATLKAASKAERRHGRPSRFPDFRKPLHIPFGMSLASTYPDQRKSTNSCDKRLFTSTSVYLACHLLFSAIPRCFQQLCPVFCNSCYGEVDGYVRRRIDVDYQCIPTDLRIIPAYRECRRIHA